MRLEKTAKKRSGFGETLRTLIYAVLVAFVIRTVGFEPFNIPSGSMIPTLLVGDYLFVSKYAYGYSRYSVPMGPPIVKNRLFGSLPTRGDVAVFKLPKDNSTDFIKRVVGLPGDRIQVRNGVLHINEEPVKRRRIEDFVSTNFYGRNVSTPQYLETLPNGVTYKTLDSDFESLADNTGVYKVLPGHIFMMGDNRDDSQDSRFSQVGQVPIRNFVGRAEFLFFSIHNWNVRFSRLFDPIR